MRLSLLAIFMFLVFLSAGVGSGAQADEANAPDKAKLAGEGRAHREGDGNACGATGDMGDV